MNGRPVTLVTGASSGIGLALAREAARRGHRLVLTARREERLRALAAELGSDTEVIVADLADRQGPARIEAALAERGLELDVLVNNAGVGQRGRILEQPLDHQLETIDVNIRALTELTRRLAPAMVARGRGAILNVASIVAFQPGPMLAVYSATKAYVLSFTEALHEELRGSGVGVTALCPGPTRTEFPDKAGMGGMAMFRYFADDPARVARDGFDALERNQAVAVSGLMNQVAVRGSTLTPRPLLRRLVALAQS